MMQSQTSVASGSMGAGGEAISRSPVTHLHPHPHPSTRKQSLAPMGGEGKSLSLGGGAGNAPIGIGQPTIHPQLSRPGQITSQEVITNQLKIKIYFGGFNQSAFEARPNLVDQIVGEFNVELDNLIRLSYLTLTLKDIHENRKWNNLLYLTGLLSSYTKLILSIK